MVQVGEVRGGHEDPRLALTLRGMPDLHRVERLLDIEVPHRRTDHEPNAIADHRHHRPAERHSRSCEVRPLKEP
jgi:hypothetical protein